MAEPQAIAATENARSAPHPVLVPAHTDARPVPGPLNSGARAILDRLLQRLSGGRLEIVDVDGSRRSYGPEAAPLHASITVRDERAWWAIVKEGSIGLGRGFIEGWWHSDDPTTVVRILIGSLGAVDDLRCRAARLTGPILDPIRRRLPARGRNANREDIAAHYDIGNDFFALFLDDTLSYSSAVFPLEATSLSDASVAKYDRILDKVGATEGDEILEIGTGWGGFAIRTAQTRGCTVTTTTISDEQRSEAVRRVHDAGLEDRIDVLSADWRDLAGTYDRVVSIEMIEAVNWRDYERYFAAIERCLRPDGVVGIQAICVPDRRFMAARQTEDFIRRFVFPGGGLPSIGVITDAVARATNLQVLDVEDLSEHYRETLRRWRANFDDRIEEVRELGFDDRFCRLWNFYLSYCEAAFAERHCTVNQFVIVGRDWRPDGLELRPH